MLHMSRSRSSLNGRKPAHIARLFLRQGLFDNSTIHTPTVTTCDPCSIKTNSSFRALREAIERCRFVFVAIMDVPPRRYLITPPPPLPGLSRWSMEGQSRLRLRHTTPHIG